MRVSQYCYYFVSPPFCSTAPPPTVTPTTPPPPAAAPPILTQDRTESVKGFKAVMVRTMTASGEGVGPGPAVVRGWGQDLPPTGGGARTCRLHV